MDTTYQPTLPTATGGPYVICIGRQLGSGGRQIGRRLAEQLHIAYYDSEVLGLAAHDTGISRDVFAHSDEHRRGLSRLSSFMSHLAPMVSSTADFYDNQLSSENLFQLQSQAIRRAAEEHSCVIIGRAADYVLRHHPRCFSVFVSANMADRVRRVMEHEHVSSQRAHHLIEHGDRKRADFYNFYSEGTWGAADTYHLLVNSSVLGIAETTEMIRQMAVKALHISEWETDEVASYSASHGLPEQPRS